MVISFDFKKKMNKLGEKKLYSRSGSQNLCNKDEILDDFHWTTCLMATDRDSWNSFNWK